jgi:NADH:ubiquinone oxidoreductase subunit H
MVAESLLLLVILLIAIAHVLYADRKSLNLSAIVEAQRDHGLASWLGVPWLTIFNWYRLPLLPMFLIFFRFGAGRNGPPFDLVESRGQQRCRRRRW